MKCQVLQCDNQADRIIRLRLDKSVKKKVCPDCAAELTSNIGQYEHVRFLKDTKLAPVKGAKKR